MYIETINNRKIPYIFEGNGNENLIVIISHGFGSSKESPTAVLMAKELNKKEIGAVRYDFPAHGESEVDGDYFRIDNCLNDLKEVEKMITEKYPKAEIAYFSSSFGAFINLIYLSKFEHKGKKSFLRCAAVDMPGIMKSWLDEKNIRKLNEQGYIIFDEDYVRPLKITKEFYEDLEKIDLFNLLDKKTEKKVYSYDEKTEFPSKGTELMMIHGMEDETAPYINALNFSKMYNIEIVSVEGADHRFTFEGAMDKVAKEALEFFEK